MKKSFKLFLAVLLTSSAGLEAQEKEEIQAKWEMPPKCAPFSPPRIKDLKEELHQTGYRLVIAIHPKKPDESKGETDARDLFLINADGSGLKRLTKTPEKDENKPRTSPDGTSFTFNWGDFIVDVKTLKTRPLDGGYAWTPDSKQTVVTDKKKFVFKQVATGKESAPVSVEREVDIVDVSQDGNWGIFEIRNFRGCRYSIDFMSMRGGEIRKMPNYPKGADDGECHPAFSPDGKWMCWNAGGSLAIRAFDPSLPTGTDGKIVTLPREKIGQDPCGRWSHCGRYIAYVNISHVGSWETHSPIHIVRVADGETMVLSPPGWVGHHWDYDWLPPEEPK
jgi:Tol biopolymer transport system component